MIKSIRHRGLRLLYERGDRRRLPPTSADKIDRILARLDVAGEIDDMALPGFHLHRLKGDLAGYWSVTVSANWRIIFRFEDGFASDIDLLDYH